LTQLLIFKKIPSRQRFGKGFKLGKEGEHLRHVSKKQDGIGKKFRNRFSLRQEEKYLFKPMYKK